MDINKITIIGRLTRDPELKFTSNQKQVCQFSIANNGMNEKDVSYFDIIAWNKIAEMCNKYLSKGNQVCVEGRLQQDRWTNKDGQNRQAIRIVANLVQFISTTKKNESNDNITKYNKKIESNNDDTPFPDDTEYIKDEDLDEAMKDV